MPPSSDQNYLLTQQYNDGSRLSARGSLHARFGTNKYDWFDWLFDHIHIPTSSQVLELGCGLGWLWLKTMTRIPAAWDITLSDFSQGMLDATQQQLQGKSHAFHYAIIDAQAIPYPDEHFDAVIANHMLYHVPDRSKALAEIRRVLKPGGRFYASTVGTNHLRELIELFPERERELHTGRTFPFNLENGGDQLATHFAHVIQERYDNTLVITEAEPLVAYFMSMSRQPSIMDEEERTAISKRIQDYVAEHGAVRLTNEAGLFEAW